jgi:hypothetical protein
LWLVEHTRASPGAPATAERDGTARFTPSVINFSCVD